MLCPRCETIIQHGKDLIATTDIGHQLSIILSKGPSASSSKPSFGLFVHHLSGGGLKAAVESGCYLCNALWETISDNDRRRLIEIDPPADQENGPDRIVTTASMLEASVFEDVFGDVFRHEEFGGFMGGDKRSLLWALQVAQSGFNISPPNRLMTIFLALPVDSPHTRACIPAKVAPQITDETWSLAKRWIRECISSHGRCKRFSSFGGNEGYPTRLVEVEHTGNSHARVIITSDTRPAGPYIALSHRWGSAALLKLTADRLSEFKEAIPLAELPQCFIDAFSVARKLSVRYIWIDSLCIIQDSHVDWYHEASQMGRIYSRALCNLSATGAVDTSEGLFLNERLPILEPHQSQMPWMSDSSYILVNLNYWSVQVSDTPLNRRGWVVQERLLARRVLHFGRNQLLFECFEKNACEQYPYGVPPTLGAGFKNIKLPDESSSDYDSGSIRVWHRIVEAYTSASLTNPSDKVIALSGLVSMFRALRQGDEYLAGLWRSHLPTELAWHVINCSQADGTPSVISTPYRAPSWSWLKLDGHINAQFQFADRDPPSLISVLEANVLPAVEGRDAAGGIGHGIIRLAGCLKRVRLVRNPDSLQPQWIMIVRTMAEEDQVMIGIEELEALMRSPPKLPLPAPRSSAPQSPAPQSPAPQSPAPQSPAPALQSPETSPIQPSSNTKELKESWLIVWSSVLLDIALPDLVSDEGLCALPLLGPTSDFPMVTGLILAHLPEYPRTNAHYGQFARIGMFLVTGKKAVSFMLENDELDRECPCEWYNESTEQHIFSLM